LKCDDPAYVVGSVREIVLVRQFTVADRTGLEVKEQLLTGNVSVEWLRVFFFF
jgi:hypothetical protein